MVDELSNSAKKALEEMSEYSKRDIIRSVVNEGIYFTVVEGGFHTQELSEDTERNVCVFIASHGVNSLEKFGR